MCYIQNSHSEGGMYIQNPKPNRSALILWLIKLLKNTLSGTPVFPSEAGRYAKVILNENNCRLAEEELDELAQDTAKNDIVDVSLFLRGALLLLPYPILPRLG